MEQANDARNGFDFRTLFGAAKVFVVVVLIPTLIASIYFGLVASDQYVAEIRYAIRSSSEGSVGGLLDSVFGTVSSSSSAGEDAIVVRDYILSRDMLEELDGRFDLRSHFLSNEVDFWSRLTAEASIEDYVEYYRDKIDIQIDPSSHISTLSVRAFDAATAERVGASIIDLSEALVNRMTERIFADTLRFAQDEVEAAENRVRRAADALAVFRSETQSIDPGEETSAVLGIVAQLEGILAAAKAELIQAESFMNPDGVQIRTLRARVEALDQQIRSERTRLSSESDDAEDYAQLIDAYEPLILEKTLAEQRYASALTSLEAARAEAQRKQRYLITFVEPKLPDEAIEPKRLMSVLTVFIGALLMYGIGGLIWAAIKDHLRM